MHYNKEIGQQGEELAKKFLIAKGYEIIETNPRASYKEIDIVARLGDKLVFVEVKTRTSSIYGGAEEAMSQKKINHLKRAVWLYLENKKINYKNIGIDFIAVDIDKREKTAKINHFEDII